MTDPAAPDALVQHAEFVRRLAWHLLRDDDDADDAAQEAMARAIARPPPDLEGPRPWLAGVVRNVVRRLRRDERRRGRRERVAARGEALDGPDSLACRAETLRAVGDAVASLPEPLRAVVLLRHYDALPPREIAARLGVPVETVYSRLKRAHQRLRERLDGDATPLGRGWRTTMLAFLLSRAGRDAVPAGAVGTGTVAVASVALGKGLAGGVLVLVLAVAAYLFSRPEPASERDAPRGGAPALAAEGRETVAHTPVLLGGARREKQAPADAPAAATRPADSLEGLCVDELGAPIEGATVYTVPQDSAGFEKLTGPHATTDALGRFAIDGAVRAGNWICAVKDGFLPAHLDGDAPADQGPVRLAMAPGREVVVDISSSGPQGLPANVWVGPDLPVGEKALPFPAPGTAWRTSAEAVVPEGRVTLRIGTQGAVIVNAWPNHTWWLSEPHEVRLAPSGREAAFHLVPSGVMKIRVLREDGRPLEGPFQTVRLAAESDTALNGSSTTNPDRTGALDDGYGIRPGTYRLRVFADGYAVWTSGLLTFARPGDVLEVRASLVPDPARSPGTLVLSIPVAEATGTSWYREAASPGQGMPGILVRQRGGEWFSPRGAGISKSGEMHSYESTWNEPARELRARVLAGTYDVLVWDRSSWTCGYAGGLALPADGIATAKIRLVVGVRVSVASLVGEDRSAEGLRLRADGADDLPAIDYMTAGSSRTYGGENPAPPGVVLAPLPFGIVWASFEAPDGARKEVPVRAPPPK